MKEKISTIAKFIKDYRYQYAIKLITETFDQLIISERPRSVSGHLIIPSSDANEVLLSIHSYYVANPLKTVPKGNKLDSYLMQTHNSDPLGD